MRDAPRDGEGVCAGGSNLSAMRRKIRVKHMKKYQKDKLCLTVSALSWYFPNQFPNNFPLASGATLLY
jgi:hypothetical protein